MTEPTQTPDDALRAGLQALDHLGEGEPDGIGVAHAELDRLDADSSVAAIIERTTTDEEWERLARPDYSDREIAARLRSVKSATAKALGVRISEDVNWTDFEVPRLAERPFRVRLDRFGDNRIYAASMLVERTAVAAAARFPDD